MSLTQFTEILDAIRGISFGPREADELREAIDCRAGRAKSTASADSALAAVYAAIEREAKGYDNAGVLSGLAELVTALKPRAMFNAGPVLTSVSGDASPITPFPNRPVF